MRHHDVFRKIQETLMADINVLGIMLMGSVASGSALPESDLDIMILNDKDYFITDIVDGIFVEYIFTTYETRLNKLLNNDMEVYHFLGSNIVYDVDNKLSTLMSVAKDKKNSFKTSQETKKHISHWLTSVKTKLLSAINSSDTLKQNFIVSTNSWKIIEAIWAINDTPVPPSGSVIRYKNDLIIKVSPLSRHNLLKAK